MKDLKGLSDFIAGVIDEAQVPIVDDSNDLEVTLFSPALGENGTTLQIIIPREEVESFVKSLPLFDARYLKEVRSWSGREFCTQCSGPYSGWLDEQYGGHWDTCPNRHAFEKGD